MQTVWSGYGIPFSNMLWTESFVPLSFLVILPSFPNFPLTVPLPATTHGVGLWTAVEEVWFALNENPGPIPAPQEGPIPNASVFRPGAILIPGLWQTITVQDSSQLQVLHLVSLAPSAVVRLTAFTEETGM